MIAEHRNERREREGIRILLVEDNPGDVGLVEAALEESGDIALDLQVEPRLAPALHRLSRETFSVLLLDLNLPDSKGFETVASVQAVVPRLPVVIMTGNTDEGFARIAINAGVQDYLIKDEVKPASLVRSILFAIERKRIENELHALERMATAASASLDLDSLVELILNTLKEEVGAHRAALVMGESGGGMIEKAVGDHTGTDDPGYRELEKTIVSKVMTTNEPAMEVRTRPNGEVERTMLKVPLVIGGKPAGVIQVDWLYDRPKSDQVINLLRVAADKVAAGIANAQAFEAVRSSERRAEDERLRLRTIIDNLPVGVFITNAKGKELESNRFRERIWGGRPRPTECIGDMSNLKAWWADTGAPVEEFPVARALRSHQTTLGAVIDIERLDGTKGTILSSAAPIFDQKGELIGAVALQQDITEQVRLERELSEAKGRAEFYLDLLTHDIDNSLAAASGYIQLLQASVNRGERAARWLSGAATALQASIDLIATVRKVQRSRTLDLEHAKYDLNAILTELVTEARARNPDRAAIRFSTVDEAKVVGNDLLRDLFNNLIENAIKHSNGKVIIEVDVRPITVQGQEFFRVEVADDGKGVPDDLKGRLFIKGVRGTSNTPGQGLGLFLAYNIATGIGGRIWVEDRVPGDHTQGARFVVLLPRAE